MLLLLLWPVPLLCMFLSVALQFVSVNPKPFLLELTGKTVVVKLKWGMEYKGQHTHRHTAECGRGSAGAAASAAPRLRCSLLCCLYLACCCCVCVARLPGVRGQLHEPAARLE